MSNPRGYDHDRIRSLFGTHPLTDEERATYLALKKAFEDLAHLVLDQTPSSPHQTIAINKLLEAKDAAVIGYLGSRHP